MEGKADAAGNGTHEVRNWLVAHGAAGEAGARGRRGGGRRRRA